jgi:hypothetical protein
MGLSAPTNAHGELSGQNNYAYFLCSDTYGSVNCDGNNNKVLGLSAPTNAHGEIPSLDNYNENPVCFGDLRCGKNVLGVGVLSLSNDTNAHIGNFTNYNTKIYCSSVGTPQAYWSGPMGEISSKLFSQSGTSKVYLVINNPLDSNGDPLTAGTVDFEIKERKLFGYNKLLPNININPDTKRAKTTWTIPGNEFSDGDKLYFKVKYNGDYMQDNQGQGIESGDLTLIEFTSEEDITGCSDYQGEDACASDPEFVAEGELTAAGVNCSDENIECFCSWDSIDGCEATETNLAFDGDGISTLEEGCVWTETSGDPDDPPCADGKIERTLVSSCDMENPITIETTCPAEVQLPFFGAYNFVATLLVIALVYYFVFLSHSRKKK